MNETDHLPLPGDPACPPPDVVANEGALLLPGENTEERVGNCPQPCAECNLRNSCSRSTARDHDPEALAIAGDVLLLPGER